jgi:hypothetical protein
MMALALLGAAACRDAQADVEPLPPLRRPTPEERAGLPVLSGRWLFTGFEYPVGDTLRVREQMYRLVPPGEFRVTTQRLDSLAGQYVRDSVAYPFVGEVRRDGIFTLVATEPGGAGQFVAGHFDRDTLWIELTAFPSAGEWPPGTRVALVRNPRGPAFTRLRGYVPPPPPPVDSSLPLPSAAGVAPPAPASAERPRTDTVRPRPVERPRMEPGPPNDTQPWADTGGPVLRLPAESTPPAPPPRRPRRQRDTVTVPQPTPPEPSMPRDTIRFPTPR